MWWIIGAVAWVACGVPSYLILRWDCRKTHVPDQFCRAMSLAFSCLGPVVLAIGAIVYLCGLVDWDRPAKW